MKISETSKRLSNQITGTSAAEPKGGWGLQSSSPLQIKILKPDFVDTVILNVLCDLPFSPNQPLESTND
jgi:hypothetical protein